MAYSSSVIKVGTLLAGADLSTTGQFRFVDVNNTGKVVLATGDGRAIGTLQNNPASGRVCEVDISGVTMVQYGGNITAGGNVKVGSNGVAVATTNTDVVAVALESGASGDIRPVLLLPITAA